MLNNRLLSVLLVLLLPVMVISYTLPFYKVLYVDASEITQDSNSLCEEISSEKDIDDDVEFLCAKKIEPQRLTQLCMLDQCALSGVLSNAIRSMDTPPPQA